MNTIRKYGIKPFQIGLLHGGPGAAGELKPLACKLSDDFGVLELLQSEKTIKGQVEELKKQLASTAQLPAIFIGHSWGAWLGVLFASQYPNFVRKLILIGAAAFDSKYTKDLMNIRLGRLNEKERSEANKWFSIIGSDNQNHEALKKFGRLMAKADSYDYAEGDDDTVRIDPKIYFSVWEEAFRLRESGELLNKAGKIQCPVVAIHGDYDPHPIEGVEKPLSKKLRDFKIIKIENCGHIPWRERHASQFFFEILKKELENNYA